VYNCFKNTVCGSERRIVLKHVSESIEFF